MDNWNGSRRWLDKSEKNEYFNFGSNARRIRTFFVHWDLWVVLNTAPCLRRRNFGYTCHEITWWNAKNWTWYNRLHSKNSKIIRTIIMSACVDFVDMFRTLCTCWLKKNVGHESKKSWKVCSSLHVNVVIPKKSVDVDRAWFLLLLQLFLLRYGLLLWKLWF